MYEKSVSIQLQQFKFLFLNCMIKSLSLFKTIENVVVVSSWLFSRSEQMKIIIDAWL